MNDIHNTDGFTLIEVLIAMVILSIGILTLYTMQIGAIKGNSKARTLTEIANIAQNQMEQILTDDFADVQNTTVGGTPPVNSINWTVTEWRTDGVDNDGDGKKDEFDERGVKNVNLTVQYKEGNSVKTSTYQFIKTEIF